MKKVMDAFVLIVPNLFPNLLILFGFILVDFIWLRALPKWGISYGSGNVTAVLFSFLRVGFFVFWILLQIVLYQVLRQSIHLSLWLFWLPNILLLAIGVYGFCIEPFHLTESRMEIQVPGLDQRMRIIQLSDIHVERVTKREQALPEFVAAMHPDMIVVTGDLINESYINTPQAVEGLRGLMGNLNAPLGIYVVNGNVEPPKMLQRIFEGLDVRVLQNEVIRIPELGPQFVLVGLNTVNQAQDAQELKILMSQTQESDFSLLLYHKPDLIYDASDLNVDLYLAGHTHGGQIRLPFYGALFTNSRYGKAFEMGLYQIQNTKLFVSRGLGFTGGPAPRIRFLAPPEVVIIDLLPAASLHK